LGSGWKGKLSAKTRLNEDERALMAFVQMDNTTVVLGKKEFDGLLERSPVLGVKSSSACTAGACPCACGTL